MAESICDFNVLQLMMSMRDAFFMSEGENGSWRILSLNIQAGKHLIDDCLSNYIQEVNADFIILQEVYRRNIICKTIDFQNYVRFFPNKYIDNEAEIVKMNGRCGYTGLLAKQGIIGLQRDDSNDCGTNRKPKP